MFPSLSLNHAVRVPSISTTPSTVVMPGRSYSLNLHALGLEVGHVTVEVVAVDAQRGVLCGAGELRLVDEDACAADLVHLGQPFLEAVVDRVDAEGVVPEGAAAGEVGCREDGEA